MRPILNGLMTGLFLQFAIGPVFFFIFGITIESNYLNSLSGIFAVTVVDYLYIGLAVLGLGKMIEKDHGKKSFGLFSSLVLALFGVTIIIQGALQIHGAVDSHTRWNIYNSFMSCFILTLSSPLTIVFWGSVFSLKAMEYNYKKNELIRFGIGAGLATSIFFGIVMLIVALLKKNIPVPIVRVLNIVVGIALAAYSSGRLVKILRENRTYQDSLHTKTLK